MDRRARAGAGARNACHDNPAPAETLTGRRAACSQPVVFFAMLLTIYDPPSVVVQSLAPAALIYQRSSQQLHQCGILCCGYCKFQRHAEPSACTGQHTPPHYLLSTITANHALSTNAAKPCMNANIFHGLAKQTMKLVAQSPAPAIHLQDFPCDQILQYEILRRNQ